MNPILDNEPNTTNQICVLLDDARLNPNNTMRILREIISHEYTNETMVTIVARVLILPDPGLVNNEPKDTMHNHNVFEKAKGLTPLREMPQHTVNNIPDHKLLNNRRCTFDDYEFYRERVCSKINADPQYRQTQLCKFLTAMPTIGRLIPCYIVTDGNVNDYFESFKNKITNLSRSVSKFIVVIIEDNNKNYFSRNCVIVNKLYDYITKEPTLRNKFKCVYFFNNRYSTFEQKFVAFNNVAMKDSMIQYGNQSFHVDDYPIFLTNMIHEIIIIRKKIRIDQDDNQQNDMIDLNYNDPEVDDMLYRLKNPSIEKLKQIRADLYKTVEDLVLATEVDGDKLRKFFDKLTNTDSLSASVTSSVPFKLYDDLVNTLGGNKVISYTSILHNYCIYDISALDAEQSINMGFRKFHHSAVYNNETNALIPILPINDRQKNYKYDFIISWIKLYYSSKYGVPVNSQILVFVFLLDNMYIQNSNVPYHIKKLYETIARIVIQYSMNHISTDLDAHSKKLSYCETSYAEFIRLIPNLPNYPKLVKKDGTEYDPNTVCFMMFCSIKSFYNEVFHTNKHFPKNIAKCVMLDGVLKFTGYDGTERNKFQHILESNGYTITTKKIIINNGILAEPEYYCFVTLTDTSETGGYMIRTHKDPNSGSLCKPPNVLSREVVNAYSTVGNQQRANDDEDEEDDHEQPKYLKCPCCTASLTTDFMIEIEPEKDYEQKINTIEKEKEKIDNFYRSVIVFDNFSTDLIKLNELDFTTRFNHDVSFKEHIIFGSPLGLYTPASITQKEFNKKVPPFLLNIDWTNIVVAGGMCRSILLGQPINDIDIFFIGLNKTQIKQMIVPLINNIVSALLEEDEKYSFVTMYKPENSVVEILCMKSTLDEEFYDKETNIPINEKFLFTHHKIINKIQIIVRQHDAIQDIFEGFDMYPCCVAFDGETTYFNEASFVAFKYMINIIDKEKSTHAGYSNRLLKYYNYGFAPGLDKKELDPQIIKQIETNPELIKFVKISDCMFELMNDKDDNNVKARTSMNFMPIKSFQIVNKSELSANVPIKSNKSMYLTHSVSETDDDNTNIVEMLKLYDYINDNNIKYCYLFGVIDEGQISEVINLDNILFPKSKRDSTINWYSEQIIIKK